MHAIQGRLNRSCELYQQAAQWIRETGGQHLGASSLIEIGIADVLCEQNDLDSARVHVRRGLDLIHLWGKADDLILAYVTLARVELAQGKMSAVIEAVEKARRVIQTSGVFPEAPSAAELAQVKLWLARRDIPAASRWAASCQERLDSGDPFKFENEVTYLTRARVLIAQNKPAEAVKLLLHLEGIASSAGRMGRVIEILLLQALALQLGGDPEHAIAALEKSLTLAEPQGYVRIFLDEGGPMQLLLARWLAHADNGALREYVIHLLSQFEVEPPDTVTGYERVSPTGGPPVSPEQALVEPLSARELEVLQLLALGKTNEEIARQLIVSRGTIKAHTASIYRKLDVANRTEAAARARDLGILP
jgi:LuxR family maltose regulon positive regulatory protein